MTATAHVIRDPAALVALEPEWWTLWRQCPGATPFQTPAWLLPWWGAFAPGEMLSIEVRIGGRLAALAPFYLHHGTTGDRILPLGVSISDYHDMLVDPRGSRLALDALAGAVAESGFDWELPDVPPDAQALRLVRLGMDAQMTRSTACPVMRLPDSADNFEPWLPPRQRKALHLSCNRAARHGAVEVIQATTDTAPRMLEMLIRQHARRWESKGEAGVLADPNVQQFHRSAIGAMARAGILRLFELRIAGEPAAVYYGFQHRDRAFGYLMGFDPRFAFESPGVVLLAEVIRAAIREGASEFHFLRGEEPYKYRWGAENRWNQCCVLRRSERYARAS